MITGNRNRTEAEAPALAFSRMRREDLAAVLTVEQRSFVQPWSAEFFLQELRLSFSRIVVARTADRSRALVGYVCRWITSGELHILNVAVHPDWRRRSIGRRLVSHVIEEARRAHAERATLEVRRHNHPAVELYRNMGFSEVGLRRNYYGQGEDALIMERRFDSA